MNREAPTGLIITPNVQSFLNGTLSSVAVVSFDQWPIWAREIKRFSQPADKGIGDVVARMIGDENSAKFKAWHLATFGKPCGCAGRQARWNRLYPLT